MFALKAGAELLAAVMSTEVLSHEGIALPGHWEVSCIRCRKIKGPRFAGG